MKPISQQQEQMMEKTKPTMPALQNHLFLFPIPFLEQLQPQPCLSFRMWLLLSSLGMYKKCSKDEASLTLYKQSVFTEQYPSFFQLLIKDKIFQMWYESCRQLCTYLIDLRKSNVR